MAITLSHREKKQLDEIKSLAQNNDCFNLNDTDTIRMKKVLDLLQAQGYIKKLEIDGTNMFLILGNFQDFDDWLTDQEKQSKLLNLREWAIAIISALIGAVIGRLV